MSDSIANVNKGAAEPYRKLWKSRGRMGAEGERAPGELRAKRQRAARGGRGESQRGHSRQTTEVQRRQWGMSPESIEGQQ